MLGLLGKAWKRSSGKWQNNGLLSGLILLGISAFSHTLVSYLFLAAFFYSSSPLLTFLHQGLVALHLLLLSLLLSSFSLLSLFKDRSCPRSMLKTSFVKEKQENPVWDFTYIFILLISFTFPNTVAFTSPLNDLIVSTSPSWLQFLWNGMSNGLSLNLPYSVIRYLTVVCII